MIGSTTVKALALDVFPSPDKDNPMPAVQIDNWNSNPVPMHPSPLRSGVDLLGLYGRWFSRNYILNKGRIMGGERGGNQHAITTGSSENQNIKKCFE